LGSSPPDLAPPVAGRQAPPRSIVGSGAYHRLVLTVAKAAQRVGRSPGTVRRWIREGRLQAETVGGQHLIDPGAVDEVRDEMYPMLPLPPEWQKLEDGTPAPNWVAAVALSRLGR
jgi:excisionase family DNA binding protein